MSTQRGRHGEPQPAPTATQTDNIASKRDLTSWWRNFKRGNAKREEPHTIFGVPLLDSVRYANVAISLFDNEGKSYIYGYVPIVVAKCGVFLKEKATETEGIFRLSGSEKRIKELKAIFDSPERKWGKGLDWTGFTVHDASNVLRRYFNTLPEPIIPLSFYERFREPIRGHQAQAVGEIDSQGPITGPFDPEAAIRAFQTLVTEIPPLNRQLLLYILDLLAVFAAKADINKMTTNNLAAIFQPGLLSHPQHALAPSEYRLSQDVLIFLINNQDSFLIGMQGTGADEKTVQDIQSGPRQASTPPRAKTSLGRSSSNASAGADSIRRFGGLRRNVSVSSRNSRGSVVVAGQSPVAASFTSSPTIGVHRSNTVPSKKSPAIGARTFQRPGDKPSDPPTPTSAGIAAPLLASPILETSTLTAPQQPIAAPSSEETTPRAEYQVPPLANVQIVEEKAQNTPSTPVEAAPKTGVSAPVGREEESQEHATPIAQGTSRTFTQMFTRGLSYENNEKKDGKKPNKLQKRRAPSSVNPSAHSSTQSLTGAGNDGLTSPLPVGSSSTLLSSHKETVPTNTMETSPQQSNLKPVISPSPSFQSQSTHDMLGSEHGDESVVPGASVDSKKKHQWRFSHNKPEGKPSDIATNQRAQQSTTSFSDTSGGRGRKSMERVRQWPTESSTSTNQKGPDAEFGTPPKEHRGISGWLKGKLDKRERAKSPPDSSGHRLPLQGMDPSPRGKSMEVPRRDSDRTTETIKESGTAEKAGATAAAVAAVRNVSGTTTSSTRTPTTTSSFTPSTGPTSGQSTVPTTVPAPAPTIPTTVPVPAPEVAPTNVPTVVPSTSTTVPPPVPTVAPTDVPAANPSTSTTTSAAVPSAPATAAADAPTTTPAVEPVQK